MVKKSFGEDFFPLFVIDLKTTQEIRDIIRDNSVSISLKVSYYNIDDIQTDSEIDDGAVTEIGILYDTIIRIYDKPFVTTAAKVDEEADEGDSQITSAPFVYYRVSGIPEDLISKNENSMNIIYEDCTLLDATINLLTRNDPTGDFFIQDSTNKTVYKDILVPPLALIPAINYIDNKYYHLYEHDINMFIDTKGTYVYDILSENVPVTNTLEINIISADATGDT